MNQQNKDILSHFKYFVTKNDDDCSYIDGKLSRILLIDPQAQIDTRIFSALADGGFRRSGELIYKPSCNSCAQCLACRIPVADFKINSMQKKAWKRNQDLKVTLIPAHQATQEHAQLYVKYIQHRHADKQSSPPDEQQFYDYLVVSRTQNIFIEYWLNEQLIAVSACDMFDDGLSAVYTFFDPDYQKRSLGVFSVLMQVEYAKSLQLDYVYLGYWIPHSQKMNYKAQYQPLEILYRGKWERLSYPLTQDNVHRFGNLLNRRDDLLHAPAQLLPIFNPHAKPYNGNLFNVSLFYND